jgi:alanyl-tRNA synthetase
MNAQQIRQTFLDFFASKGHQIVPSAPMVIKNDPTLMFTNAGMNQFKDIFLGNAPVKHPRVADTQKCLRVSGKHNDLEEVGVDTYHHTMFEMLGNWSFGDYFKKEAIAWAWELLTEVYKMDKNRLYVTVFEGDASEQLPFDQDAYDYWKQWIAEDRILRGNKKDNFWEMGDTGPCGPCSEIHVDLRSDEERQKVDGKTLVNESHPQVIEIWNNVFMEFNRKADGSLEKLPAQHVDTGMGFERLCMALQGKQSNYDTDVFQPLIQFIEKASGISYGAAEKTDIAMRVMADHIRTIAFAIADGQLPSNNKAGYVIRRILRRAVRYAYTFLNLREPFLCHMVPTLASQMGTQFPELASQQGLIEKVIQEEEQSFLRTLETGIGRFNDFLKSSSGSKMVPGEFAFELFDTFGFPIDLTQLMAREQGLDVDMPGFLEYLQQQKERSRAASAVEASDWVELLEDDEQEFIGYDFLEAQVKIVRYREVSTKGKKQIQLVFNVTPFYAESGGQVGDTGSLEWGSERIQILDTRKEHGVIVHFADRLPSDLSATYLAKVDAHRREATMRNHSATHLLHAALRDVLGTHVEQKGSLVNDQYLRFDFSHFSKVSDEELEQIERMVNARIRMNNERRVQEMAIEEARKLGAMALFGEKYGDLVRVVSFDPTYSIELCGGTHVNATGNIGLFRIVSEGAVAAGVRRIEAITGEHAENSVRNDAKLVEQVVALLKGAKDPVKGIEALQEEKQMLEKKLEMLLREKAGVLKTELKARMQNQNGRSVLIEEIALDAPEMVKNLAFELKDQFADLVLVLGHTANAKPMLTVALGEQALQSGLNAGTIVRELAKEIQGGGGGQPFYATAGGSNSAGMKAALEKAKALLNNA